MKHTEQNSDSKEKLYFKDNLIRLIMAIGNKESQATEAVKEIIKSKVCGYISTKARNAIYDAIKEATIQRLKVDVKKIAIRHYKY